MINAEFLRKVSKDRGKALTCQYLTDIDDDNIKELLNKAIWASIGGRNEMHHMMRVTVKESKFIKKTLEDLGFRIGTSEIWNFMPKSFIQSDEETRDDHNIFTMQIFISWHDGD